MFDSSVLQAPPRPVDFSGYIKDFEAMLHTLFHEKENINTLSLERGLPPWVRTEIMSHVPLSVAIPTEFGGRGAIVKECLAMLAAASYESLPLSLTFGINIALFLEPVAKYAQESVKAGIFERFINEQALGGLMITEPDYGSDALNMKTVNREFENTYHIKGTKHWQGLTGLADFWIIASRKALEGGDLNRDIDFFICDTSQKNQQVQVTEVFDSLGLYMIPYGRNELDLEVPKSFKLQPESTGIKMMLDILHRSRLQFPGMGMGFIKRMLDEAIYHCDNRLVGGNKLLSMDQIQFQLSRIQSAYTICSAMCAKSSQMSGIDHNLAMMGLEANSMKALVTDLMHESAQLLVQMSGANGYRISHIGGRGIMDSRPFQIFEGSNEMLYHQIAETMLRLMKKEKETQLFRFLKTHPLTTVACEHFKNDLSFEINTALAPRKLIDLGKVLARIIAIGNVLELQEKGFRQDLVQNCMTTVRQEITSLIRCFGFENGVQVIHDYDEQSSWISFS